ncbi:nodulation protein U [Streptomyces sp. NBC_01017]|uniref:carbamoyltransferase N-terminal domain-containing protein n=1 Tax=Streptomyces sp. NBC_01017 TaxID=2903721 RepID=UPI00386FB11E|nr:nodulation protein U [Streptomyces sp. NBC_01017]WSV35089.1 nodulation protein U [Streptomyces sp. NBC_01017]
MLICGLKMTHDGGIAVIDGNRLIFSIEMEKLENLPRYSPIDNLARVERILSGEGVDLAAIDRFVVDGWLVDPITGRTEVPARDGARELRLPVASYAEEMLGRRTENRGDPTRSIDFTEHNFSSHSIGYSSYHHSTGHVLASYCASPFAARGEDSLVLTWDGGTTSRLYHATANPPGLRQVATILPFSGHLFSAICCNFDPFRIEGAASALEDVNANTQAELQMQILSVAGKAMAYAALGTVEESAFPVLRELLSQLTQSNDAIELAGQAMMLGGKVAADQDALFPGMSSADIIATLQAYIGNLILEQVTAVVQKYYSGSYPNLALAGGCALNIKWNTKLRASGLFSEVWAPPFPNDSGAAIGAACCEMFSKARNSRLNWNVYSGPRLTVGSIPEGWCSEACDERQLAELLVVTGEPVVFLSGRAEIGPRALGGRSILAPATDVRMKDRLNAAKGRAGYRPVAPICLSSHAPEVFSPGTPDPYMLFEHHIRPEWEQRIPAVAHLDGTARLQTVDPSDGTPISKLLSEYERLSGIPVLCNTSANLNGRGFFPDAATATEWGRINYVWSEGTLFRRSDI